MVQNHERGSRKKKLKLKPIKCCMWSLAVVAGLASAAKAQVVYDWDPNSANRYATSGTLTINHGVITSFSFSDGPDGTFHSFGPGVVNLLGDGDLQLLGVSLGLPTVVWSLPVGAPATGPKEDLAITSFAAYGDWVPAVPEPTTMIAGALLLLPFFASALRFARRERNES
jgi:hypothetical protein